MKPTTNAIFGSLFERYPALSVCRDGVCAAFETLLSVYAQGGKALICGNGGSAADCEHIAGELMKTFKKHRPLPADIASKLPPELASKLEAALPAISLVSMTGIMSAAANDVSWEVAFAQQALGLANKEDVLIAISTSGNSANCVAAAEVMKAIGGKTVALTGENPSKLAEICDIAIKVPASETYRIQELHLPVYHTICAMLEEELF